MAVEKRGQFYYGTDWDDLDIVLKDYAKANRYMADKLEKITCPECSSQKFVIYSDDEEATCKLKCRECEHKLYIGDSEKYINEDELDYYTCLCENNTFHVTVGTSLYEGSSDIRWLYVGGYCPDCGLLGNYVDWNER